MTLRRPAARTRAEVLTALAEKQATIIELQLDVTRLIADLDTIECENRALAVLKMHPEPLYLPIKEAARIAGRSVGTIKRWCREHGFGWQTGGTYGRWVVGRDEFLEFLKAKSQEPARAR